jgi:starch phosphorylase
MRPYGLFNVVPSLPTSLTRMAELAYNLRWTWDHDTIELFRRLDPDLWEFTGHNPVRMLGTISQKRLQDAADDDSFLAHFHRVSDQYDAYMNNGNSWYAQHCEDHARCRIAYFSPEFGLTESIPIYSGGLGVLSGDHLKSSSDLGLDLVGVGLLYQYGYFSQYLSADGWQQEHYPVNDFYNMPIQLMRRPDGAPVSIQVNFPDAPVTAEVWRVRVGRISLYMLDSNLQQNRPQDRDITGKLYGGDRDTRMRQEILLGIGGYRALTALELEPTVCHMNEGHAAFLSLERVRVLMERMRLNFQEAMEVTRAGSVFTTHTAVPAGIDIFSPELVDRYFGGWYQTLGISRDQFLALGRQNPDDRSEPFSMAVLAVKMTRQTNAVSRLHATVARRLWQNIWPQVPEAEIPIDYVTNGVHLQSWVSRDLAALLDRYLGPRWTEIHSNADVWARVNEIPDEELWRTHERRRERLVHFARHRLRSQLEARGAAPTEVDAAYEALNPEALTIGFARRFATYKRATLLLRDPERFAEILHNPDRPVQLIVAGKAHPQDQAGKELISQLVRAARQDEFRHYVVFLENYDLNVARYLVQGVDIWLNTPRRLQEASGTSGMKATANGVLNVSVLDGWWAEAYTPDVGWSIGRGEIYDNPEYQDDVESRILYELLEKEIVPLFYTRGRDGLPRGWLAKMKAAMSTLSPTFSTSRMVMQYAERFYVPAGDEFMAMQANGGERAKQLAAWRTSVQAHWSQVRVERVEADALPEVHVRAEFAVRAVVSLGSLTPKDVRVELYHGNVNSRGEIDGGQVSPMWLKETRDGKQVYEGTLGWDQSGLHGYTVRVLPAHEDLPNPFDAGAIYWLTS